MSLTIASLATATEFSLRPEWSGSSAFANGAKAPAAPAPQTTPVEIKQETTSSDGDWPTGPMVYERDWLLKFRANHTTPPEGLPSISVVCPPSEQDKLRAAVFQQQSELQKQFQQQKRDTKIRPQLGKARTEALVKGEDRWLPSTQDKKKHTKTMEQAFLSNLNKLTLETFGLLSRHLAELVREAASATQLQALVTLVVDKAIVEQKFSAMYAQLCVVLTAHAPFFEHHAGEASVDKVSFHAELLNRCQTLFLEDHADDMRDFLKAQLKINTTEELDEEELKYRARIMGNIKFMGELYKLRMISEKIMRKYIVTPLEQAALDTNNTVATREMAVEKLGKLLMIIGEHLDKGDGTEIIFANVKALSIERSFSSRHRFLLLDLIDMRSNGWVSRHPQDNPQRISEVHNDADDYSYSLPAELLTGIAAAAASLPRPSGEPSREQLEGGWVRFLPGGKGQQGDKGDDDAASLDKSSSTASVGGKSKGRRVSFEVPQKSAEERVASMIEEFFSSHDVEEAAMAFGELGPPADYEDNIVLVLAECANSIKADAKLVSELFQELKKANKIEGAILLKGFHSYLDILADLSVDSPNAPRFTGQLLKQCISRKVLPSSALTSNKAVSDDKKLAEKIVAAMK